jgi:hypothetical protein
MGEERVPNKMQHTKTEEKQQKGRSRTRWIGQIRKDIKMRGEN